MHLELAQYQGRVSVTVFEIVGEINTNTNKQLQAEAERSIAAGTHDLLLDLTQMTYISSAGLRAIHTIFKLLSASPDPSPGNASAGMFKSPHFKLLNPSSAVCRTLNMTGFDLFLDIHTDLDEAVASF